METLRSLRLRPPPLALPRTRGRELAAEQRRSGLPGKHHARAARVHQPHVGTQAGHEDQILPAPHQRQACTLELGYVGVLEQALERLRRTSRMRLEPFAAAAAAELERRAAQPLQLEAH